MQTIWNRPQKNPQYKSIILLTLLGFFHKFLLNAPICLIIFVWLFLALYYMYQKLSGLNYKNFYYKYKLIVSEYIVS